MKKAVFLTLIFSLLLEAIFSMSGCRLMWEEDKRRILNAYTSENSGYKFYTFKAEVRSIRTVEWGNENEKFFEFDVDYDYFQQAYGDDDHTFLNGQKRWEGDYSYFNHFEFRITPGSTYQLLCENGGYYLLQEGTEVIITANSFYGYAGWLFPILSLEIDGTVYLDFETGLEDYLNFINAD